MSNLAEEVPEFGARPDIFRAAREDNAQMLRAALDAGESLTQVEEQTFRNPLHIAALFSSRNFIREALAHPTAEPWSKDGSGLLPADLCWLKNDFETHDILFEAMYYKGWFLDLFNDQANP